MTMNNRVSLMSDGGGSSSGFSYYSINGMITALQHALKELETLKSYFNASTLKYTSMSNSFSKMEEKIVEIRNAITSANSKLLATTTQMAQIEIQVKNGNA